jgi:uncharacterized membrane protein YfcA
MPSVLVLITLAGGVAAGALGALVGVGGGIVIVPLLHVGMGLTFREATAASLIGVLAMSSSIAASGESWRLLNARLALVLLIFGVSGAISGVHVLHLFSDRVYELIFGITAVFVATMMLVRLDRRNIFEAAAADPRALGGRIYDPDTGREVSYRVRRLPFASAMAFGAGVLASFIGVGGGILVVPGLNSWCGVPMRVAAATSVFMIGVTAVPGAIAHWAGGYLSQPPLAGAAALGILAGYRLGQWLSQRAPVRSLKLLMATLLLIVAAEYLL